VKELQQLLCARQQQEEAALSNDDSFWYSLQCESRTLKSFSDGVLRAKAEKLRQQGALSTVTLEFLQGQPPDHHISALSISGDGLH
jgi:hypothetical protein